MVKHLLRNSKFSRHTLMLRCYTSYMRKMLIELVLLIWLITGVVVQPAMAQAEEWVINQFQSDITIQSTGIVLVEETIAVDFRVEKHGIFRHLPYIYQGSEGEYYTKIDNVTVKRNNQDEPFAISNINGDLEIKIGDANKLISGQQSYQITYHVAGVLQAWPEYDELYWNITGNQWDVPIQTASAVFHLPQNGIIQHSCYVGPPGSSETCPTEIVNDREVHFTADRTLPAGQGMTIAIGYTKDMVPILKVDKPLSIGEQLWLDAKQPLNILLAAGSLLLGISLPWWLWWKRGRDWWWQQPGVLESNQLSRLKPWNRKPQVVVEFTPPENLRPAQLGVLLDETADTLDITSTIIDLASRGFITITELDKTWVFGSKDYQLDRTTKSDADLLAYERLLLDKLFGSAKTKKLSELKNTFYSDLAKVKEAVYKDLLEKKYFVAHPQTIRNRFIALAFLADATGIGLVVLGYVQIWYWAILLAIAPIVAGVLLLILSRSMPQRTALGFELYRRALGYKLFISTAESYKQQFFERKNIFTEVLPYAMMLGLTEKFAKAMEAIDYKPPAPNWYHGAHAFNAIAFSHNMSQVSQAFSTTMASTPGGSGSGGGGSSGGGFGGGGGGSW